MSTLTHELMTNNHVVGVLAQLSEVLHIWHKRYQERQELAQWSERDLHDVGLSRGEIISETEKPFWRA